MVKLDKVRTFILEKSKESPDSKGALATWSRAINKNHAYLHQFIHRGTPAKLSEDSRSRLAEAMGVDEAELKDTVLPQKSGGEQPDGIIEIDVRAGLGGGGTVDQTLAWRHGDQVDPIKSETWKFPAPFVHNELRRSEDRIKILETYGDSMSPTIQSGDRVIIDTDHTIPSPDGLYAIRDRYGSIVVKRLQSLRRGDPPIIRIISDNKAHDPEDVGVDEIAIIGRVLWGLKRL